MIEEVETKILEGRSTPVHFAFEYFDSSVFPADKASRAKTVSFLQQKYHGRSFDLVLTIGGRTLDFAEKYHTRLFPDAALLFFVVDAEGIPSSRKAAHTGGVVRKLNYLPTLQLALRQNPGTRHVVVISGSSDFDKLELAAAHEQFRAYEPDIDFQYWTDLNVSDLRSRLAQVDADAVVLFLDYLQDPEGEQFTPSRILRTVSSSANRPIYGTYSSFVENGIVGGSVVDMREIGRVLGQAAVRSLNGEKAESIPITVAEFQHYMFDWRQLHRWNVATDQLPAGSAVLNYQYSPWEIYRWRIVGLLALLGLESALIVLLLRNNAKRKRAEIALQSKEEQLAEAQRLAQLTAWRWDPKNDVFTCSETFFSLTGFDPKRPTYVRKELSAFFTDESWTRLTEDMTASLETGGPFELELKGHRSDRTQVWITIRGEAVRDAEGRVIQLRGTMQDISERKRADEARLKHTAMVESSEDAIISKDLNGIIVSWNVGAQRMFGFSEAEAAGHPIRIIIPPERQDEEQRILQRLKAGEQIEHYETVRVSKEGKRINVSISISPVRDAKGRIVGACKIARDITKQKLAEELLRRSEEKFSKAFRQSPMAITLTSAKDHRFIEVNDTFQQATGWSREEVIGHTPFDLNLWQDRSPRDEMVQRILAGQPVRDLEVRLRNRNGESRIGLASADLIEIDAEPCILTAIVDITERKLTEEKLRDSENLVAGVVGSAMDAIITVNEEQRIVLFNAAAEKIFACSAQDALGKPIKSFIPERFRVAHSADIRQFGETGVTARAMREPAALWARRTNGEEFPIEASFAQLEASGKKLFTVIIRDVTARRQADTALRESERRFRLVSDTAPVMIWMAGTDKLFNYFNRPWVEFTGRPVESEMGNGWVEALHPEDRATWGESYRAMFDKRLPLAVEYRLRRHDGEYRWVSIRAVPRFQSDGSFAGYIGCGLDVTEEKEAKAALAELGGRLIQAQERERSRIARELHDDISQRLALLANRLGELNQASGNTAQAGEEQQLEALFRLTNEIANDVQNLSHRLHPSKLNYVGLASAARQLCQEVSRQHKIEIECQMQDIPRDIEENISLSLFRTIQESLRNAVKHSHAKHAKVELTRLGGVIRLRVSDDGVGFDSKGTGSHGLGLVSMQERLRSVGGEFSIWSRPSLGTQVEATVPAHFGVARSA